jgi:ribosomal RNA-processing protein 8
MFAISGWSVSADKLRTETPAVPAPKTTPDAQQQQPSKKRKRKQQTGKADVTTSNVAELWEKVVEGKAPAKPAVNGHSKEGASRKDDSQHTLGKRKRETGGQVEAAAEATADATAENEPDTRGPGKKKKRRNRNDKGKDATGHNQSVDNTEPIASTKSKPPTSERPEHISSHSKPNTATAAANEPAPVALTPLQRSMRDKLVSARFRHLNEALYTKPSEEAYEMFEESPEMFSEYHEGFRRQVQVWPENPVDGYIATIRDRARRKSPHSSRSGVPSPAALCPLPRSDGICTVADLGCGDARLAETLRRDSKRLRVKILSFDLQANGPYVTRADIAALPIADGSVDVAIFCLALMGTNWVNFIEEAYRVLRWKGELWVAEIKSRFARPGGKGSAGAVVEHSVGKRRHPIAKRKADEAAEAADELDLSVEVDGAADMRRETDVKSFVDVLRKRGFVLHPDRGTALDLSNKMFVKMHFVKAAVPTKGKGVSQANKSVGSKRPTFLADMGNDSEDEGEEGTILKPCVYKLR